MTNIHNTWRGSMAQVSGAGRSGRAGSKMTPRRCSTTAAVVLALAVAVALAPALTPAALAYDAEASRPDDLAARFMLPDWDTLGGAIDPFGDTLIPRRAMESPREGWDLYDAFGGLAGGYCYFGGCAGWFIGGLAVYGVARAVSILVSQPENKPDCTIYNTGPDCF